MARRILIILSSHADLAGEPNGTYLPELTHAIEAFDAGGVAYDLVSVDGGAAPGYGHDADDVTREMLADPAFSERLKTTGALAEADADAYDAVYFPGGYGLLFDLVDNTTSGRITAAVHAKGGVIGAVCHGPAALSGITLADGDRLIAGRAVTGFTREEEVAMKTLDKVPFLVGTRMVEAGATYVKRGAWAEHVIQDGQVITGQNPPSAKAVGEAMVKALAS